MFCAFTIKAQQNLVLNGSFENNTATSHIFNLSNTLYNYTIAASSSFGPLAAGGNYGEIDLYTTGGGHILLTLLGWLQLKKGIGS